MTRPDSPNILPVLEPRDIEALLAIADSLASGLDLGETLRRVVRYTTELTKADFASIGLLDGGKLVFRFNEGFPQGWSLTVGVDEGITGWVFRNRRIQNIANVSTDSRFKPGIPGIQVSSELAVPLIALGGEIIGVLDAESTQPSAFSPRDELLLSELARRAALAIVNAQRFTATESKLRQELHELKTLEELDHRLAQNAWDVDAILRAILEAALQQTDAAAAQILLYERSRNALIVRLEAGSARDNVGMELPLHGKGVTVLAFNRKQPELVYDARDHPAYLDQIIGMNSELAVPILAGDLRLGVLNLESRSSRGFHAGHVDLATRLAYRAAITIHNAQRIRGVHAVAMAASSKLTIEETLDVIYRGLRALFEGADVAVFLRDPNRKYLRLATGPLTPPQKDWTRLRRLKIGEGVVGRAVQQRRLIYEPQVSGLDPTRYRHLIPNVQSSVGLPILADDDVLGGIAVESPASNAFGELDFRALETIARYVAIAVRNAELVANLKTANAGLVEARERQMAAASLSMVGEIATEIVHEIGNRIGIIPPTVGDLLPHIRDPEGRAKLSLVRRNVKRVLRLGDGLAERIAHVDNPNFVEISLRHVLRAAIEQSELGPRITTRVRVDSDIPGKIRVSDAFVAVLKEIITNARKAIGREKGWIKITASTQDRNRRLILTIANSGEYIPRDEWESVFGLRSKSRSRRRRRPGMHLGLWWVRHVLRRQGGTIRVVASDSTHGTVFEVVMGEP